MRLGGDRNTDLCDARDRLEGVVANLTVITDNDLSEEAALAIVKHAIDRTAYALQKLQSLQEHCQVSLRECEESKELLRRSAAKYA